MPILKGIHYTDAGSGPVILFLHGFCETHTVWKSVQRKLVTKYRVIAIDIPGFGQSDLLAIPFTLDQVALSVLDFMKELSVGTFNVVGHSMGGYIMLSMANKNPGTLNSLCLFQSTALPDTNEKKVSRNKVIEFVTRNSVQHFIESFIPPLFFERSLPAVSELVKSAGQTSLETVVSFTEAMRDRPDRRSVLKSFDKPILFVGGVEDPGIMVESLKEQAAMAKFSTLVLMDNVAHMGMLEQPDQSAQIVENFLSEVSGR